VALGAIDTLRRIASGVAQPNIKIVDQATE
jgi:hypothetical protein